MAIVIVGALPNALDQRTLSLPKPDTVSAFEAASYLKALRVYSALCLSRRFLNVG